MVFSLETDFFQILLIYGLIFEIFLTLSDCMYALELGYTKRNRMKFVHTLYRSVVC